MTLSDMADDVAHEGNVRKRVGKACDRCRLKKSKCDGNKPCSRCKADNQLCLFGERKKSHDKVYPKGYVELLEHQQALLVNALQRVYKENWNGAPLPQAEGGPLVHDMLESLGLLQEDDAQSSVSFENFHFEEDPMKMQARLTDETDSKHSPGSSGSPPALSPVSPHPGLFRDSISDGPATPLEQQAYMNMVGAPSNYFSFTQSPEAFAIHSHLTQANPSMEQMKSMGYALRQMQPEMDFETFANSFPMLPTFGDMVEFGEEDAFTPFVDLGPS